MATYTKRTNAKAEPRRLMTPAQVEEAKTMLRQGMHPGMVAAHFDVSYGTIYVNALRPVRDEQRQEA